MVIIYKAQNTITGECYIGATTKSNEEEETRSFAKSKYRSGQEFHDAISSTGFNNFMGTTRYDTQIRTN
jgi:hypothetical protein